jgi:iron complex outermembrane recepter protein
MMETNTMAINFPAFRSKHCILVQNGSLFQNWSFEVDAMHHGKQFLNDSNTMKIESYFLVNLRTTLSFNVRKGLLQLSAGVNNLFDSQFASMVVPNAIAIGNNEARYYYPGMPRNGYIGLRYIL